MLQNKFFVLMKLGVFLFFLTDAILYVHCRRQENVPGHKASKERLTLTWGGNSDQRTPPRTLVPLRAILKRLNEHVAGCVAFESHVL